MTTLDPAKIAAAAIAAYALGTLCAQQDYAPQLERQPTFSRAFYINPAVPGVRCAIGAGLTEEQARKAQNPPQGTGYSITDLLRAEILPPAPDPTAAGDLYILQRLHDEWGQKRRCRNFPPSRTTAFEVMFVKFASALANNIVGDDLRTAAREII